MKKLAKLTSDIVNPFSMSLVMIILLCLRSATTVSSAIKWALLAVAFSILPVLAIILYLVHNEKLDSLFIKTRQQRSKIYLLAIFCVAICIGILFYLGAPAVLLAALISAFFAIIIYMGVNLWWKISVHTGFAAASITMIIILYGAIGLITSLLLPIIGWSRVKLEHHSPAQVAVGAALSALTVVIVFSLFGLVG
ncbi:hypothetical protein ACFLWN_02150 [Chloroflexota bacterium]